MSDAIVFTKKPAAVNSALPPIPLPVAETSSLYRTVLALRQAVLVMAGGLGTDRVATLADLKTLGISTTGVSSTGTTTSDHLTVHHSVALPKGTTGTVFVDNTAGIAISIALPPSPSINDQLEIMDVAGNAGAHTVTFMAVGGALLAGTTAFYFTTGYQAAKFIWNGASWSVS